MNTDLHIGIVGAGNFACFAAEIFMSIPGIRIIAVSDVNAIAVNKLSKEFNAQGYSRYEDLLENKNIDLVYIATPPFLHYIQSKMALQKGKHVISEKPAALKTSEAMELNALSASLELLWVVNLMQRYNPLFDKVKKIIDEKILGSFVHGFFENYASDENLAPGHWFWDESKSGGIFIEHGVHFFDMFAGWLGEGKLLHSCTVNRDGTGEHITDRVQATILYNGGLVNFYHGFNQPVILDRQEIKLQFEFGELSLHEWVPVCMRLYGLIKKGSATSLTNLLGTGLIKEQQVHLNKPLTAGRYGDSAFESLATFEYNDALGKQLRYQDLLKEMLTDQWSWIKDRQHTRKINGQNAIDSLRIAEAATLAANKTKTSHGA